MVTIKPNWIYGHCTSVEKVGGLTGHPGILVRALLMEAKHLEAPHYPCTTCRVVLGSDTIININ